MDASYSDLAGNYRRKDNDYYGGDRSEMIFWIPETVTKVLDVGCSNGGFGKILKDLRPGIEVWGLEPNRLAAAEAGKRLDSVINATFSAGMSELDGETFDCVVFNDVLEHLPNPDQVLTDVKPFLRENGFVVASIPNILYFPVITRILIEQDWKYEDWGVLDNTHLRFFTKKSILRLFDECGYDVTSIGGIRPCWGKKYNIANILLLNRLKDWRYQQFALQAKLRQADLPR